MGILVRLLILCSVAALTSSVRHTLREQVLRVMPRSQSSRIFSRRSRPQFSFGAFSSISDADTVNLGGRSLGLGNSFGSSGRGYLMLNGDAPDAYNPYDLGDAPDIYPIIGGSSLGGRGLSGYQLMYDPDNTFDTIYPDVFG